MRKLVISVVENSERLATIYFHLSGYTKSVYNELRNLIDMLNGKTAKRIVFDENGFHEVESAKVKETDTLLKLLRLYESIGGGLSRNEFEAFEEKYPNVEYKKNADRNNGLIDFTEKSMADADKWAEATATINLDTEEVFVNPFYYINTDDLEVDDVVTELKEDPRQFRFDEMEDRYDMICSVDSDYVSYGISVYGVVKYIPTNIKM
jgi:hypothetical protein